MMNTTDKALLRVLMRQFHERYGCRCLVSAMFDIGTELEREAEQVGPPTLASIICLDDHRSGRRRRDRPDPTPAA